MKKPYYIKKRLACFFVCQLCLLLSVQLMAQHQLPDSIQNLKQLRAIADIGQLSLAKNEDGIRISYRDLEINEQLTTRELRAEFVVKSSEEAVIEKIRNAKEVENWNEAFREVKMLEQDSTRWITHNIYQIPFPFQQQDLIAEYHLHREKDLTRIATRSLPQYMPPIKKYKRESFSMGEWQIIPLGNGLVKIVFSAISLSSSNIPKFIKDPVVQLKLKNSLVQLKASLEKH